MTIKPIVRVRKLTSFSDVNGTRAQFPVILYVYDRRVKYYLSTSFHTNDVKFNGRFNDKGVTYEVNKANTDALAALVDRLMDWYNNNYMDRSVEEIKDRLTAMVKGVSVDDRKVGKHLPEYIEEFADTKKKSTGNIYRRTAKLLREYKPMVDIMDVTVDWLDEFCEWMTSTRVNHNHGCEEVGLARNTKSIHLRNLRAVLRWLGKPSKNLPYNRVFEEYHIENVREDAPFTLDFQQVADFRDYPCEPWQEKYRDVCMLSLYLAGCNTNDLLLMGGLTNGRFVKRRGKTDSKIDLPVCDEAMDIINKYRGKGYLLDIMDGLKDYQTFAQHLNRAIKTIGLAIKVEDKVGKLRKLEYHALFPDITMYTFRYTFGTLCANIEGVSQQDVGICMAHSWAINGNVTAARYINNHKSITDRTMAKFVDELRKYEGRSKDVIDAEIRKRDGIA